MAKKKAERPKPKKKEDPLKKAVAREARKAAGLLELDLPELYSLLGSEAHTAQSAAKLAKVKPPRGVDKTQALLLNLMLARETPLTAGKNLFTKYWPKILRNACKWWEKEGEKFSGSALISNLALAVAPSLPTQLRAPTVLTLTAAILVKADVGQLCEEKPERPPLVEEEVKEEERPPEEEAAAAPPEEKPEEAPPPETPAEEEKPAEEPSFP